MASVSRLARAGLWSVFLVSAFVVAVAARPAAGEAPKGKAPAAPAGACASAPQGSCAFQSSGATSRCEEYAGYPASTLEAAQASCEHGSKRTWSASACARAGAIGGCRSTNLYCVTTWYFAPAKADAKKQSCEQMGGTWVAP